MAEPRRRRRRQRRPTPEAAPPPPAKRRDPDAALRGLVGPGATALPPELAMRARDVARPGPADLAAAERAVQIVRRNYRPPVSGTGGSSPDRS